MKTKIAYSVYINYEQVIDMETGEILETKITDKKIIKGPTFELQEEEPRIIRDDNKLVFNTAAIDLMKIKPGDRLDVLYKVKDGKTYPVIGDITAFGIEGGCKLSKSNTITLKGAKNIALSEYGTTFTIVPQDDNTFQMVTPEVDSKDKDEAKDWEPEKEDIDDGNSLVTDDSIFVF